MLRNGPKAWDVYACEIARSTRQPASFQLLGNDVIVCFKLQDFAIQNNRFPLKHIFPHLARCGKRLARPRL